MGLVATPAKMPFLVVKTRLQAASGAKLGTFETMALIAKNEGVPALWKGTVPAATRMSLGGAVSLSCFRSICLCGCLSVRCVVSLHLSLVHLSLVPHP